MACLRGPVSRSGSATYGGCCLKVRQSFGHPTRSCRPYAPSRPMRWRRSTLYLEFISQQCHRHLDVIVCDWRLQSRIWIWNFFSRLLGGELCCTYSWAAGRARGTHCRIWERQWTLATWASPYQTTTRWQSSSNVFYCIWFIWGTDTNHVGCTTIQQKALQHLLAGKLSWLPQAP